MCKAVTATIMYPLALMQRLGVVCEEARSFVWSLQVLPMLCRSRNQEARWEFATKDKTPRELLGETICGTGIYPARRLQNLLRLRRNQDASRAEFAAHGGIRMQAGQDPL